MEVDFPGAIPMFVDRSRVFINNNDHKAIVIHKTAGFTTPQECANYFATTPLETSSHYIVGLDGTIVQCVLEQDGSAANCCKETGYDTFWDQWNDNLNFHTITIEHIDPSIDNSTPVTSAQRKASFSLVRNLCQKYGIAPSSIKTHASIAPISRARCPGNYPMNQLIAYAGGQQMVPQGWSDDGKTLSAPNGINVVLGFREYILDPSNDWPAWNWPIEAEHGANPVEQSNPSLGGGTVQTFRASRLEWTPDRGVFLGWIGQELLFVEQKETAPNQTQSNLLQKLGQDAAALVNDIQSFLKG
jgi:hypothetical protein